MTSKKNQTTRNNTSVLLSEEVKEFEAKNAVSERQRKHLAFGSILMYIFAESSKVFNISGKMSFDAIMSLLQKYKIETSEDAHDMIEKLARGEYFTTAAVEIYKYFVEPNNLVPMTLGDLPGSIDGLKVAWEVSLRETVPTAEHYIELNPNSSQEESTLIWHVYAQKYMVAYLNNCIEAYKENIMFFEKKNMFQPEELAAITDFSAYDFARVAYTCKLSVYLGYMEEEEAWKYIEVAAKNAAKHYSSWREYLCAYIMGRALSTGKDSATLEPALKFLLEHPESPIANIDFA